MNNIKRFFTAIAAVCLFSALTVSPVFAQEDEAPLTEESLTPVYAESLQNGTYDISVTSSSSMFKVVACKLTVSGSDLSAEMTLSGKGYEKLYAGTSEEAAAASEEEYYFFHKTDEGKYAYTFPVPALNSPTLCAAYSFKKKTWYDRTLVFEAASLPEEAFAPVVIDTETPEKATLSDGTIAIIIIASTVSGAIVLSAMWFSAKQKRSRRG